MFAAVKIWLACCLLGWTALACGSPEPESAKAWLEKAASHYQGHAFHTKFEMEFSLKENGQWVEIKHRGNLQALDATHSKLDANTVIVLQTKAKQRTEIHNLQVLDGSSLWMQSSITGQPQPIVLKRSLADADDLAQVDPKKGNQLSPRDLNPMVMWDLAMMHGVFDFSPQQLAEQISLQAPVNDAFRIAAAHRTDFFQPHLLRVTLDKRSGAPVRLELIRESGEVSWKNSYFLWETLTLQPEDFHYSPPEGAQVVTQ